MDGNDTTRTNVTADGLDTLSSPIFDKIFRILIVTIIILVIVASVCGNLLVCVAIYSISAFERPPTTSHSLWPSPIS